MIITKTHAQAIPLRSLTPMTLRAILLEPSSNSAKLAKVSRWKLARVKNIVRQPEIPPFLGTPILEMTFDDIEGLSQLRARLLIECGIVAAFDEYPSSFVVADLLGHDEREIRRIRERTAKLRAEWHAGHFACQLQRDPASPQVMSAARMLPLIGSLIWKKRSHGK